MEATNSNLLREQSEVTKAIETPTSKYRMWCDSSSPYSWKLRSYFHYKDIGYRRMRSNLTAYFTQIPEKVGMSIIPVVLTPDDKVLQDTTPMMEEFERLHPKRSCVPEDPRLAALMWILEDFADEYLVRFAMHYRWGNELNRDALSHRLARSMCYGQADMHPRDIAGMVLDRQSGFDLPLGLSSDAAREVLDRQLLELLDILDRHFSQYQFLLGDRPSLADFAVFGQLYAHLYQDPFSAKIMECHGARCCNWMDTMLEMGDQRGEVGQSEFGEWLAFAGELPDTLQELLRFVAQTWLPYSRGTARALALGEKKMTIAISGVATDFLAAQYKAWSFEQVQVKLKGMNESDLADLIPLLEKTGLLPELLLAEVHHVDLYDDFTPPYIVDGVADAKLRYLRDKQAQQA